ncbi:hypothetical protein CHS0354_031286 [Potamilus streckersoni]|uniref:RRM domain-containing protein n=1 Tax=Potamilus streckersoni TaxID=2493646 RepID=A0AAE0WBT1_9BIVA|nr:hypothetical protein CHS0354_031286 [Potamilus streckersoni]
MGQPKRGKRGRSAEGLKRRRKFWEQAKQRKLAKDQETDASEDNTKSRSSDRMRSPTTQPAASNRGFQFKLSDKQLVQSQPSKPVKKQSLKQQFHKLRQFKSGKNASTSAESDENIKRTEKERKRKKPVKNGTLADKETEKDGKSEPNEFLPKRYVLFVGNLPYDVTKEQLEEHFRKTGGVKAVRIPKEKGTDRGKGFAYLELSSQISHRIALRLHHTTMAGRKINVEFTSIGGKSKLRKEKLKEKNEKLAKFKMSFDQ